MDVNPMILKTLLPPASESLICSDLSHQQVALLQLHASLLKKFEPVGKNPKADKAALDLFIESNDRCGIWEPDLSSYHHSTMIRARNILRRRFFDGPLQAPVISLANAIDHIRPGPGSSQGTKHTDFVGKVFNSKLTTYDESLWHYYRGNISPLWKLAENMRQRRYGGCSVVKSSKLTYAKKNYDISRVINTEANLNMLFQLGLGDNINACLAGWFNYSPSKQPTINRFLAMIGSLYGSHATIDLKSASDLISDKFVRWFLPERLYKTLDSVRAKYIELPGGKSLKLETFSTMGNGFTFPMQTLIFSCIVEAAYIELGLPVSNDGAIPAFSVFGDDIICVSQAYDKILSLLEWCGFTVNRTKSFNTGSFRESCGRDFFKGRDVRGVYLRKYYHETHFYSIFNRLTRWSIRNGIDLTDILRHVKGLAVFRPIPFDDQDSAGYKVPLSMSGKFCNSRGAIRYRCYRSRPIRKSTKGYETNPIALEIAAIGGYLEGSAQLTGRMADGSLRYHSLFKPYAVDKPVGSVTLRDRPDGPPRVTLVKKSTPSWDWIPHKGLITLDYMIALGEVILPSNYH